MSSLKRLFSKKNKSGGGSSEDYSSRRSLVNAPPAGKVTHRDDPHHEVWKPQYSSGDQSDDSRILFFNSGFAVCPQCGERNIWRFEEKAGVRPNGNTYGTEIFMCQTITCDWTTSFLFDDGAPNCMHYETRGWPRGVMKYPISFLMMWADKHKLSANAKHQIFARGMTGDRLLELHNSGMLSAELGLHRKDSERINKALKDHRGALLSQSDY